MLYRPLGNTVLVELIDEDEVYGTGNDDSMMGLSYQFGKLLEVGPMFSTADYPLNADVVKGVLDDLTPGQRIIFNKGAEANASFTHEGKQYAMIFWWEIRGVETKDKQ